MSRERLKSKEALQFTKEEIEFAYPEHIVGEGLRGVYTVYTPEKRPRGDVVLTPGVGESRSSFEPFALEFVGQGYRVIVTGHADPNSPPDDVLKKELGRAKINALSYWNRLGVPKETVQRILDSVHLTSFREAYGYMLASSDAGTRYGLRGALKIGHSAGGFAIAIAHLLWPEVLSGGKLVLLNPAGLTGKIETEKSARDASSKVQKDREEKAERELKDKRTRALCRAYLFAVFRTLNPRIFLDAQKYARARTENVRVVLGTPPEDSRLYSEAEGMANTDVRPILALLERNGSDITTVYDQHDSLFKAKEIEAHPPVGKMVKTKKYGHFGPLTAPEKLAQEILNKVL